MSIEPRRHGGTIIFPASLDPDAVSVVKRLVDAGFESYLVGGCVRDLLCGMIPKDFDVSTAARPRQIRSRFRNCRVIGRRFKLAHVHFGDKIIEVATFRRTPDERERDEGEDADDLLIVRDNEYGSAEEDALRRDFTINALLYDVNTDEVIDYVGGVEDLERRVLRTIGDAQIRLAEDPVRMLRAVKFASRLDLGLDPDFDRAMRASGELIAKSSPPRVLEEIYKLLTCGRAARALPMLAEYGLLAHLLPELAPWWLEHPRELQALGAALDLVDHGTRKTPKAFLLAALAREPWRVACEAEGVDPMAAAVELLDPAARRMSIPRRDVAIAKQLLLLQPRLERNKRSRRVKLSDFLARPTTLLAVDLLYVACLTGTADPEMHALWAQRVAAQAGDQEPASERPRSSQRAGEESEVGGKRRRRRRRGGRQRGSARDDSHEDREDEERDGEGHAGPSSSDAEDTGSASGSAADSSPRRGGATAGSGAGASRATDGKPLAASGAPSAASAASPPREAHRETSRGDPGAAAADAGGLRGLLKRVVRRLRPGTEDGGQDAARATSASAPRAAAPDAPAAAPPPRSGAPRSSRPAGDESAPDRPTAAAPSAEGVLDTSDDEDTGAPAGRQGEGDGPSRSRRRRSRKRGGRRRTGAARDDKPATGGETPPGERKPRRRRGGKRRSRSRPDGSGAGDEQTGRQEGTPASAAPEGGSRKSPRPSPKRPRRGKDKGESQVASSPKEPPPMHQRPEDIEDYFDW